MESFELPEDEQVVDAPSEEPVAGAAFEPEARVLRVADAGAELAPGDPADLAALPRREVTQAPCPAQPFDACGGDPRGRWQPLSVCSVSIEARLGAECSERVTAASEAEGVVVVEDGQLLQSLTVFGTERRELSGSCDEAADCVAPEGAGDSRAERVDGACVITTQSVSDASLVLPIVIGDGELRQPSGDVLFRFCRRDARLTLALVIPGTDEVVQTMELEE